MIVYTTDKALVANKILDLPPELVTVIVLHCNINDLYYSSLALYKILYNQINFNIYYSHINAHVISCIRAKSERYSLRFLKDIGIELWLYYIFQDFNYGVITTQIFLRNNEFNVRQFIDHNHKEVNMIKISKVSFLGLLEQLNSNNLNKKTAEAVFATRILHEFYFDTISKLIVAINMYLSNDNTEILLMFKQMVIFILKINKFYLIENLYDKLLKTYKFSLIVIDKIHDELEINKKMIVFIIDSLSFFTEQIVLKSKDFLVLANDNNLSISSIIETLWIKSFFPLLLPIPGAVFEPFSKHVKQIFDSHEVVVLLKELLSQEASGIFNAASLAFTIKNQIISNANTHNIEIKQIEDCFK